MRLIKVVVLMAVVVLSLQTRLFALPHVEVGDAGDLPGAAQVVAGAGALDSISGDALGPGDKSDMYAIFIAGGGTFSATTVGGAAFDTQLFLFDATGMGVYANDDNNGVQSTLPAVHPLTPVAAGLYYLGITAYDNDPLSPGGLIFPSVPFSDVFGPTGPGGGLPISGYSDPEDPLGPYTIFLTGAEFVSLAVPEPATLVLLSSGLIGFVLYGRRKAG